MKEQPLSIFEEFSKRMLSKTDSWTDLIADSVRLKGPLAEVEGKAAFIEINKPFFASIVGHEVHSAIEVGDYVITQVSTEVAVPDGSTLTLEVCEWYEIRNNVIHSLRVYFDTAKFLKALEA